MNDTQSPAQPAPVPVMSYANPSSPARESNVDYLSAARWCAVLPLVVGVSVYLLWLVTRYGGFQVLGFFTILGGLARFTIGIGCLTADILFGPPGTAVPGRGRKRLFAALLLLSNFPVAGGVIASVNYIESAMRVTVRNTGPASIDRFVMTWPDGDVDFGNIPAGGSSTRTVHLQGAGRVTFVAVEGSRRTNGTFVDYVDSDTRHDVTLVVNQGQVTER